MRLTYCLKSPINSNIRRNLLIVNSIVLLIIDVIMLNRFYIQAALLAVFFVSCNRSDSNDIVSPYHAERMEDVNAPEGFEYEMKEDFSFSFFIDGPKHFGRAAIEIFGVNDTRRELVYQSYEISGDTATVQFRCGSGYAYFEARAVYRRTGNSR